MKRKLFMVTVISLVFFLAGAAMAQQYSIVSYSDLWRAKKNHCNVGRKWDDKIYHVQIDSAPGKKMKFKVDLSVAPQHLANLDGVARSAPLQGIRVSVLPYDQKGKQLWTGLETGGLVGKNKLSGNQTVLTSATLASASSFYQVVDLLVAVEEVGPPGHKGGFKFCEVVKAADAVGPAPPPHVKWPPPPRPSSLRTAVPSGSDVILDEKNCGVGLKPNDKIGIVYLTKISGNFCEFSVDISVDQSHYKAGFSHPSKHLVSLFAYDKNWKRISTKSKPLQYPDYYGSSHAVSGLQLDYGYSIYDVLFLLVTVEGQNELSGFKFCERVMCPHTVSITLPRKESDGGH